MPDIALLALILVAIGAGYLFGRAEKKKQLLQAQQNPLSKEYFVGLNYLLNEQTDEAIETFIKALDLNNDTVDTYLALGSLFCRRGEVEKSIRVHQDLLARPSLTSDQSIRVQLELAKDYMTAGLLDRAEAMLADLSRQNSPFRTEASEQLLKIYEQEREWQRAVDVTEALFRSKGEFYGPRLAHLYCELAEACLSRNDRAGARRCLRTAFSRDRNCVRASLILGRIEFEEGRDRDAIRSLQKIARQDYRYIALSLPLLEKASQRSGSEKAYAGYLSRCLNEHPVTPIVLALTDMLVKSRDQDFALEFLASQLRNNPSLKGLRALIDLQLDNPVDGSLTSLRLLQEVIDKMLEVKPGYHCHSCGFAGREMHWRCPRCLDWGTITPAQGIEGG